MEKQKWEVTKMQISNGRRKAIEAIEAAQKRRGPFAVIIFGLCNFSNVNLLLAPSYGDSALETVLHFLTVIMRKIDIDSTVCHLWSDEFFVLAKSQGQNGELERELLAAVRQLLMEQSYDVCCGSALTDGKNGAEKTLSDALIALSNAKELGIGHCIRFSPSMRTKIEDELYVHDLIFKAVKAGKFVPGIRMDHQRILRLSPKLELKGTEALLRIVEEGKPQISPLVAIKTASDNNMICDLTGLILKQACYQTIEIQKALKLDRLEVSVNVPAGVFADSRLPSLVYGALQSTGIEPSCVQLEITEIDTVIDYRGIISNAEKMREIGVKLAIDDAGQGYSLRNMPAVKPEIVKIDGLFVRKMLVSEYCHEVVALIMNLAKREKFSVTAEGIETKEVLAKLIKMGCNYGQGYYFGRAYPTSEFISLSRSGLSSN